ncbi:MAG: long-chain fatty acid--CoA ligase, partial [Clostridia bacterium]|nr:long-chain fatty acid--CoA ligase [Clostridia bacterium]
MKSINEIIKCAYKKWKDKEYLFEKTGESFTSMTFGVFLRKVTELAVFLIKNGLKDQKILIFGENSVSYMISDLAVLAYVGISVNVNAQTCKEELVEIMKTVGISAVLYDHHQTDLFRDIAEEIPEITYFCMQDVLRELSLDAPDGSNELNESNELNGSNKSNEAGERELHIVFEEKDETVCSKIIYSSGTTSDPKGIMLSLKNIFSGWQPLQKRTPFSENDVIYLFLPLHHTYANIYNFLYSLLSGASIYLCSGTDQIEAELKQVEPTIFCAVPLIYRRIYEHYKEHLPTAFGRRIKYLYCGGAKFDPLLRRVYKECGLPMFEAYALTETASSFCIEYPNRDDFESVGTIFETLDVKIADQDENGVGEILVKGENVFLGYVNNESLTRKAFTEDGYFITGDYG